VANVPVVKASFNLPKDELEQLRQIAEERNITVTQALREALADQRFLLRQAEQNNKVLIEQPDGRLREVVLDRR
jgi:hypothetical protein